MRRLLAALALLLALVGQGAGALAHGGPELEAANGDHEVALAGHERAIAAVHFDRLEGFRTLHCKACALEKRSPGALPPVLPAACGVSLAAVSPPLGASADGVPLTGASPRAPPLV